MLMLLIFMYNKSMNILEKLKGQIIVSVQAMPAELCMMRFA